MRRLVLVVLLLLLELVGWASVFNADAGLGGNARPVSGAAPPGQLGSGTAAATCLNGNSGQASCGGGSPAGINYVTTAQNWSQTLRTALTGGSSSSLTLTPCPIGVDTTSGAGFDVYISDKNKSEAVAVKGGTCKSGASSGTITFIPYFSHAAYTIGSASSGIQETINNACGVNSSYTLMGYCNVTIPSIGIGYLYNRYQIYGTIYFHAYQSSLSGYGVRLECYGRGPCLQVGDLVDSGHSSSNTINGLNFATLTDYSSIPAYAGVHITNTSFSGGVATITTATAHGFRPGDIVAIMFTDSSSYWGDAIVATVPTATTFTYSHPGSPPSQNTPGVVALEYAAILDNAESTHFDNIQYDGGGENGQFNNFFDMWDDEAAVISHFSAYTRLNTNINWTGSYIFSGGQSNIGHNLAPVITLRDSQISAGNSNCVTDYNSNGLYIENVICQASGPWQVYVSSGNGGTGNYAGAYLRNIYSESSKSANPPCSSYPSNCSAAKSPYPGVGIAGWIAGPTASGNYVYAGNGGPLGAFQTGGRGSTPFSYYIVANDPTAGTQTAPMHILDWASTGSDSIPIYWPRVANATDTITYDVIRMTTPSGVAALFPYAGGCLGGSGGTCGYVAQGLSQSAACSGNLLCTYTDRGSSSTVGHSTNPSSYPLLGNYTGTFAFWPGSIVTVKQSIYVEQESGRVVGVGLNGNPLQIAKQCNNNGSTTAGDGYTSCFSSPTSNSVGAQAATLMTDGTTSGSSMSVVKGRLNFAMSPSAVIQPHHIITLIDSNPALTESTGTYRPLASANDTWIGTDVPSRGVGVSA